MSSISHQKSHHHSNINSQLCNGLKDSVSKLCSESAQLEPGVGVVVMPNSLLSNDVLVPVPKLPSMADHHVQPGEDVCGVSPLLLCDVPEPKSPSMAGHHLQPGVGVCVASPLLPHTLSSQW